MCSVLMNPARHALLWLVLTNKFTNDQFINYSLKYLWSSFNILAHNLDHTAYEWNWPLQDYYTKNII